MKIAVVQVLASSRVSELQVCKVVYGDKCRFRHVEEYVKPNKKSNEGGTKGSVAFLKESAQMGC